MESDVITLQEIFSFKIQEILHDRTVVGELESTGLRPSFLYKFEKRGIGLPNELFAMPRMDKPEFAPRVAAS